MLALVAGGVALTSCEDQLNIPQKATLSTETYYKSDNDALQALAAAYENFQINTFGRTNVDQNAPGIYTPARVLANHPGDDINYGSECFGDHEWGGAINEFRYLFKPEAIIYHYKGIYLSIYRDNLIIENFADGATDFQKQAVAEARVLRAFNYFLLACYWGTPPFVDHTLTNGTLPPNSDSPDAPENAPKTQEAYFEWVAKECEEAAADLMERKDPSDKEGAYRVTKGFAWALQGKALMFAGKFAEAKAALKKVIDSEKYELVPGSEWGNLFHIQGDGCPEKIFEINFRYNGSSGDWSSGSGMGYMNHSTWMEAQSFQIRSGKFKKNPLLKYTGGVEGWGSIGLPEWFANAFVENDGEASDRLKATMVKIDDLVFQNTDNSYLEYNDKLKTMKESEKLKSDKYGISDVNGHYGQCFWIPLKHVVRVGDAVEDGNTYGAVHRLNNIIVMRYAEVLLNYAECCLRTGDAATAKTYINMIQERAGSQTISASVDLETLKKEKSFEMWFEGCRYQDILRWLKADNDAYDQACIARLKQQGSHIPNLCDKVFRPVEPTDEDVVWQYGSESNSRFYLIHTHPAKDAGNEVGWQEKHKLFPYPQDLLNNNPALHQNPGW